MKYGFDRVILLSVEQKDKEVRCHARNVKTGDFCFRGQRSHSQHLKPRRSHNLDFSGLEDEKMRSIKPHSKRQGSSEPHSPGQEQSSSTISYHFQNWLRDPLRWLSQAFVAVLVAAFLAAGFARPGLSGTSQPTPPDIKDPGGTSISGDPRKPRRHFRVKNSKKMTPEKAQAIYDQMRKTMASGYAFSKHPVASAYQTWRRFNTTPYNSATHGQRHVNNYANTIGKAYGMFENAGPLPVGSVIAKDSFTVNEEGATSAGPLFIMEKMAQGFNYVSGDWRYTMIMPDGSIFGQTKGENSEGVKFCISCHLAAEQNDHLHFMPKEVRAAAK